MIEIEKSKQLNDLIFKYKSENKTIGFVPTMGALHKGHLSLISESKLKCDITVVSIFVNPTQFNDKSDLDKYPRTLENDLSLLNKLDCDIVFVPSTKEMYPKEDSREFDFGFLETVMEGANRPGHFNGVAQIVSKLFDIVMPDYAFFGKKDFQQVAVINSLVKINKYAIKIIACPIKREESGLAMSSRNERLNKTDRNKAAFINKTINKSVELSKNLSVSQVNEFVANEFDKTAKKLKYIKESMSLIKIKKLN